MVTKEINKFGTIIYYNEQDQCHREDGPALEYTNGEKYWYINNLLHRIGGPAEILSCGTRIWRKNGLKHKLNAPAVIYRLGKIEFWEFGRYVK